MKVNVRVRGRDEGLLLTKGRVLPPSRSAHSSHPPLSLSFARVSRNSFAFMTPKKVRRLQLPTNPSSMSLNELFHAVRFVSQSGVKNVDVWDEFARRADYLLASCQFRHLSLLAHSLVKMDAGSRIVSRGVSSALAESAGKGREEKGDVLYRSFRYSSLFDRFVDRALRTVESASLRDLGFLLNALVRSPELRAAALRQAEGGAHFSFPLLSLVSKRVCDLLSEEKIHFSHEKDSVASKKDSSFIPEQEGSEKKRDFDAGTAALLVNGYSRLLAGDREVFEWPSEVLIWQQQLALSRKGPDGDRGRGSGLSSSSSSSSSSSEGSSETLRFSLTPSPHSSSSSSSGFVLRDSSEGEGLPTPPTGLWELEALRGVTREAAGRQDVMEGISAGEMSQILNGLCKLGIRDLFFLRALAPAIHRLVTQAEVQRHAWEAKRVALMEEREEEKFLGEGGRGKEKEEGRLSAQRVVEEEGEGEQEESLIIGPRQFSAIVHSLAHLEGHSVIPLAFAALLSLLPSLGSRMTPAELGAVASALSSARWGDADACSVLRRELRARLSSFSPVQTASLLLCIAGSRERGPGIVSEQMTKRSRGRGGRPQSSVASALKNAGRDEEERDLREVFSLARQHLTSFLEIEKRNLSGEDQAGHLSTGRGERDGFVGGRVGELDFSEGSSEPRKAKLNLQVMTMILGAFSKAHVLDPEFRRAIEDRILPLLPQSNLQSLVSTLYAYSRLVPEVPPLSLCVATELCRRLCPSSHTLSVQGKGPPRLSCVEAKEGPLEPSRLANAAYALGLLHEAALREKRRRGGHQGPPSPFTDHTHTSGRDALKKDGSDGTVTAVTQRTEAAGLDCSVFAHTTAAILALVAQMPPDKPAIHGSDLPSEHGDTPMRARSPSSSERFTGTQIANLLRSAAVVWGGNGTSGGSGRIPWAELPFPCEVLRGIRKLVELSVEAAPQMGAQLQASTVESIALLAASLSPSSRCPEGVRFDSAGNGKGEGGITEASVEKERFLQEVQGGDAIASEALKAAALFSLPPPSALRGMKETTRVFLSLCAGTYVPMLRGFVALHLHDHSGNPRHTDTDLKLLSLLFEGIANALDPQLLDQHGGTRGKRKGGMGGEQNEIEMQFGGVENDLSASSTMSSSPLVSPRWLSSRSSSMLSPESLHSIAKALGGVALCLSRSGEVFEEHAELKEELVRASSRLSAMLLLECARQSEDLSACAYFDVLLSVFLSRHLYGDPADVHSLVGSDDRAFAFWGLCTSDSTLSSALVSEATRLKSQRDQQTPFHSVPPYEPDRKSKGRFEQPHAAATQGGGGHSWGVVGTSEELSREAAVRWRALMSRLMPGGSLVWGAFSHQTNHQGKENERGGPAPPSAKALLLAVASRPQSPPTPPPLSLLGFGDLLTDSRQTEGGGEYLEVGDEIEEEMGVSSRTVVMGARGDLDSAAVAAYADVTLMASRLGVCLRKAASQRAAQTAASKAPPPREDHSAVPSNRHGGTLGEHSMPPKLPPLVSLFSEVAHQLGVRVLNYRNAAQFALPQQVLRGNHTAQQIRGQQLVSASETAQTSDSTAAPKPILQEIERGSAPGGATFVPNTARGRSQAAPECRLHRNFSRSIKIG